ncbi:hypothetical protein CDL15_Pgr000448 [Punica granatum]|uniref:Uncharacterized protein n=1 Tax=Punica granatum TaxID=22663 RepID=A0A218W2Y2_PUNGR|nr:hypothetical protein CDL15_Pgr000448 [Punica granatum]
MHGSEARAVWAAEAKPVQCIRPRDCISRCRGCTVKKCTKAGLCLCRCAVTAEVKPVQCVHPGDCIARCHGCTHEEYCFRKVGGQKDGADTAMLSFCVKHKVYPKIELIPIQYQNEALVRLQESDMKSL